MNFTLYFNLYVYLLPTNVCIIITITLVICWIFLFHGSHIEWDPWYDFLKNIFFFRCWLHRVFIAVHGSLRCCTWALSSWQVEASLELWCVGFWLQGLLLLQTTGSTEYRLQKLRLFMSTYGKNHYNIVK